MTRKSPDTEPAPRERGNSSLVEMVVATVVGVTLGLSTGNYALGIGVGIGGVGDLEAEPRQGEADVLGGGPDPKATLAVGRPPGRQEPAAVQLACYRLAMAELLDLPLVRVRAAFHYVRTGTTVAPANLLDAAGIGTLIAARTVAPVGRP